MNDDIRLRSACDRCHSQKLRCPKRPAAEVCDRCIKSGAPCIFSPFRQKKDPSGEAPSKNARIRLSKGDLSISKETISPSTKQNGNKRKCTVNSPEGTCQLPLAPRFAESTSLTFIVLNLDLDLSKATPPDPLQLSDFTGNEWSCNAFNGFPDLMADPNFMDMDLAGQDDFSSLDVNSSPFPKYADKMDNLLGISGPPNQYFRRFPYDTPSSQSLSSLDASVSPPSLMAAAEQTPQLSVRNGNPDNSHQLSVNKCIRQLSKLSISLFEHSNTIPPLTIHEPIPENEDQQETMNSRAKKYANYSVDETFRVTQELIDIYPSFLELFTKRQVSHSSKSSNVQRTLNSPVDAEQRFEHFGPVAQPLLNSVNLDHSSILLILSCHLRVIDIYEQLFKHMNACIELRGLTSAQDEPTFMAPQLRIGSYVPPIAAAVPMQMLLLIHFATSLCDFAVELDGNIREPETGCPGAGNSQDGHSRDEAKALSLVSAQKVKERATGMLQHLGSVRGLMLREGHLA